jgi:FkbM family methyltransferase
MIITEFVEATIEEGFVNNSWMCRFGSVDAYLSQIKAVKIWGASNGGKLVRKELEKWAVPVSAYIDSDVSKHGSDLEGVLIYSPNTLQSGDVVVIGTMFQRTVFESSLKDREIAVVPYDEFQNEIRRLDLAFIQENTAKLQLFYDLLDDDDSKEVLLSAVHFGLTRDLSGTKFSQYPQYSHPRVRARSKSVIIDGGAYVGDSAAIYLRDASDLDMIHCFEPMAQNVENLTDYVRSVNAHEKVVINTMAISDFDGNLWLQEDPYSPQNNCVSTAHGTSSSQVSCVSIDSYCSRHEIIPDLIKIDLEGYELTALHGAIKTIRKNKPDLQIAIYHNPEEFIEIPLLIKEWVRDYRFFLGHHGEGGMWDTVLYCRSNQHD